MRTSIAILFFLGITTTKSFGVNPFWVRLDKRMIREFNAVAKSDPKNVESYFINHLKFPPVKENLGFGWKIWTAGVGGGYVSIGGTFIYLNDSIVCYTLRSRLPSERRLKEKYTEWLGESFQITEGNLEPFVFNLIGVLMPLTQYDGPLRQEGIPSAVLDYMSPLSGIMYGYRGGVNMGLLENR
jgi:hypothetical protein